MNTRGRSTYGWAALALGGLAAVAAAPTVPASAQTLDELYAAAKKEGALSIVAAPDPRLRKALTEVFAKRFPGITLDISGMPGAKVMAKLQAEGRADVSSVDAVISGTTTGTRGLKPAGLLGPLDPLLVLPEVRDPKRWAEDTFPWADKEKKFVIAMAATVTTAAVINTDLVKPGEVTSDADFLDPKWKGKIITNNPFQPGGANKQFRRLYDLHGPDYLRKFVAQEPVIVDDLRQAMDFLVKGRYAIGFGLANTVIDQYAEKGVKNVSTQPMMVWKDVGYVSPSFGGLMVPKAQPHPAAARLFVNWLLTDEGQETVVVRGLASPSYRKGVDDKAIPDYVKMQPNLKYRETYSEAFLSSPAEKEMQTLLKSLLAK